MITPELLSYIRGELAKGRTREEVRADLVKGGGWKEEDLTEAFRIVIPMQGFFAPTATKDSPVAANSTSTVAPAVKIHNTKAILGRVALVLVIAGLAFAVWFYRAPLKDAWASVWGSTKDLVSSFGGADEEEENNNVAPNATATPKTAQNTQIVVKDCGVTTAPDLKNVSTYRDNTVLNCLGGYISSCTPARATLTSALLPSVVEITKTGDNICKFKLSYSADNTLVDDTGSSLAGQYITCPVNIVKMVDESGKTLIFKEPTKSDLAKYASQLYYYGVLGVFMEQNVEKSRILSLGCTGPYIDSVVAGYNAN